MGRVEVNEAVVYLGLLGRAELEAWLEEASGDSAAEPLPLKLPKSLSKMVRNHASHVFACDSVLGVCVMVLCTYSNLVWNLLVLVRVF